MNVSLALTEQILPLVDKPSRYLGTELNAVHKDRAQVEVRLALAFPDLYDLGLGNLGIHILYACVNALPWAWCERVYAPAPDMERELRARGLPLFGLESRDALSQFDGLGFTLQSELTYTNILAMIDLAGIPLRSEDRGDDDPLVFAGGPAVFNPEPIAPFTDFFVIGDGEDAILEIANLLRALKGRPRADKLQALALLEGVYVPALYPFETLDDGQILPVEGAPKVRKRLTRDLNGATFPVDYIVPFTQQVHDRISLEVLRGCTQGCRFCQAGMVTRPVRERSLENVSDLLDRTLKTTGYEEVSLVSLSTCDYSRVRQLVDDTVQRARQDRVSVSLPSLRLDSWSVELSDMTSEQRRTGLTFAPEAASPRLRALINKWIPDDELLDMSDAAFSKGWDHVKLYFMIGLPTERDDDIDAIADLAIRTLRVGRQHNASAKVNLGVSTFVPKPFTPFQWAPQIGIDETDRKQARFKDQIRRFPQIRFGRHHPEETFLEGLVSRADRRAADLLEAAWRKGCRFDAWREHLRFDLWLEAIEEVGYDCADALRERDPAERLPWDHIDVLIPKEWFVADWQRAMVLEHAEDCRHRKCHRCGVIDHERALCATMLRDNVAGRKHEAAWTRSERPELVEPPAEQRLWLRVARTGVARFLSHLEAMNAWMRALRRAGFRLSYSQGFHPHPKLAFSEATPSGYETTGLYLDITLTERLDPAEAVARLQAVLPEGFGALSAVEVGLDAPSLMSRVVGCSATLFLPHDDREVVTRRVEALLEAPAVYVERRTKHKKGKGRKRRQITPTLVQVDLRPMIQSMRVRDEDGNGLAVDIELIATERNPKPRELLPLLSDGPDHARVLVRDTWMRRDDTLTSFSAGWTAPAVP